MNEDIITIYIEFQDQDRAEYFIYPDTENLRVVRFYEDTETEDIAIGDGSESEEGTFCVLSEIEWIDFEPSKEEKEAVIEKIKEVKQDEY